MEHSEHIAMPFPERPDRTPRRRMLDAILFRNPDRIPVIYHPSPAGLYVHGRKLLDLFCAYPPDNPITFDHIPAPPPHAIDALGAYHEFSTDDWGTQWEYLIFGIQGHPKYYPFSDWKAAATYPFPAIPSDDSPEFLAEKAAIDSRKDEYLIIRGWISLFEKLHALRPMDEVMMDLATGDPDLVRFLDRMEAYWHDMIDFYVRLGADVLFFGDDWGGQHRPLVSQRLFREHYRERYRRLIEHIRSAGKLVFFHSCGQLGNLFDEILSLGVNGIWPQIASYDEITFREKCLEHKVATYIHPDRQRLIPLGTPAEIDDRIRRYADAYHKAGGGGIFYVEMENDAPFENVAALITAIDRYR